jgi:hypothetical protein
VIAWLCVAIVIAVAFVLLVAAAPEGALGNTVYYALCSKPVPTATSTPTVTPTPRVMDVRIEASCSRFQGGSAQDPSGEYVCLKNHDWEAADLAGWRLEDEGSRTYWFPEFVLAPGSIVRVHSGPGLETATDLYWARGLVWNNDHDIVTLYDHLGRRISRYVY